MQLTSRLTNEEMARLHAATIATLIAWRDRLIAETGDRISREGDGFS